MNNGKEKFQEELVATHSSVRQATSSFFEGMGEVLDVLGTKNVDLEKRDIFIETARSISSAWKKFIKEMK